MTKTGLSRPGAMQMVASATLMVVAAIGPAVLAVGRPNHEWLMVLNGPPALAMVIASLIVIVLYCLGFFRYCSSKGYSTWLGFWLFIGNLPGFIVLLLLPDLKASCKEQLDNTSGLPQISGGGENGQ